MTLRVFLPCVAALVLSLTPTRATAISEYITRIHATLTLEGPSAEDIIVVVDVAEHVTTDDRGSDFPSFSAFNGSASYDEATHTLTVIAETNGAANFAGGIPVAVASGMTRTRGTLGLINPSEDIGFFIDVRIQASFEYTGVLSHPAEFAETIFALDFAGSRLSGLPPDGTLVPPLRTSTEDPGFENGFDLVTSTAFLAVDETYSVLIPPGGSGFVIHDLGFLAQAGGAAASRVNGSTILALESLPEVPPVQSPEEFLDPDDDGVSIDEDRCPGTVIPEVVPTRRLGRNRWALSNRLGPSLMNHTSWTRSPWTSSRSRANWGAIRGKTYS